MNFIGVDLAWGCSSTERSGNETGVVALDSTRNLLETFSGVVLHLRLDRPALPEGLDAELVAHDGDRFTLRLRDYDALGELLLRLRQAGATIAELDLEAPDLEEVFLRVMERH